MARRIFGAILLISTTCAALAQSPAPEGALSPIATAPDGSIETVPIVAQAVMTGDEKRVIDALDKDPKSVNDRVRAKPGARAGFTPLIIAAALSNSKMAEILIQRGATVTSRDDFNRSAFWYAALREDVGTTRILTEAPSVGDAVNVADDDFKRTPLHLAVRGNQLEVVELLIKVGASGTQKDILGETPRDYCKHNSTVACKALP